MAEYTNWFAAASWYNRPLPASPPLSPHSAAIVAELVAKVAAGNPREWLSYDDGGVRFDYVPASQPRVKVTITETEGQQEYFEAVPVPETAAPAVGSDRHYVVICAETGEMWEFWGFEGKPGEWKAGAAGYVEDLAANYGIAGETYPPPLDYIKGGFPGAKSYFGATATSLPLIGGLITLNDLRAGAIDHALALALPVPKHEFVFPAQRDDPFLKGTGENEIPEGCCFSLPSALDVPALGLPPLAEMMALASQEHGIIVRDSAPEVTFYGQEPLTPAEEEVWSTALGGKWPNEVLEDFPFADLQVVDLEALYVPTMTSLAMVV